MAASPPPAPPDAMAALPPPARPLLLRLSQLAGRPTASLSIPEHLLHGGGGRAADSGSDGGDMGTDGVGMVGGQDYVDEGDPQMGRDGDGKRQQSKKEQNRPKKLKDLVPKITKSIHGPDMAAAKSGTTATAERQDGLAEEGEEQRLKAALRHLQAEAGVLERLVYKHRNQHRSAAYFQYLIRVRRDLKLLLGSNLAEVINAMFPIIACRKPANTILVPNRHGKKKPGANHSHYKRLLGAARLLSQMVEPVIKGAVEITFLLARSFFIEFCTAVLALLARVRVLIQQMLIGIVSVYNKVTDLMDGMQAVKITIDKVQAFREYYPSSNDPSTILECVWVNDKFVLKESSKASCQKTPDEDHKSCAPDSSIQYETLGPVSEEMENLDGPNSPAKQHHASLPDQPDKAIHQGDAGDSHSGRQSPNENSTGTLSDALAVPLPVRLTPRIEVKPDTRKRVAFIAVGKQNVTVTRPETTSSVVTKKQRVEIIPHATEYVLCNFERTTDGGEVKKGQNL